MEKELNASRQNSLSTYVFKKLREGIISGKYKENDELRELAIGNELGVSRTPVREALRQLELEGLVNIVPNKGAYVIGISTKDIHDIYEMRSLLEGLCAKKATKIITEEQLAELESILDLSDFYYEKGKMEKVHELDNSFHEGIYSAADSKMLKHTLSDFHQYIKAMRKTTLGESERVHNSNMEHRALLEAMKERDAEKAAKLAREHIAKAVKNIKAHDLW